MPYIHMAARQNHTLAAIVLCLLFPSCALVFSTNDCLACAVSLAPQLTEHHCAVPAAPQHLYIISIGTCRYEHGTMHMYVHGIDVCGSM